MFVDGGQVISIGSTTNRLIRVHLYYVTNATNTNQSNNLFSSFKDLEKGTKTCINFSFLLDFD